MQIELTPEQDDAIRHAIETGRIARPEDAVAQAVSDWVERERQRVELLAIIDAAEASIARREGVVIETDEDLDVFFDEIMADHHAHPIATNIDQS